MSAAAGHAPAAAPAAAAAAAGHAPAAPAAGRRRLLPMPPGVTCADIVSVEEMMERRCSELAGQPIGSGRPPVYDSFPEWYVVGDESLPVQTNLHCPSCALSFAGRPWIVPVDMKAVSAADPVTGVSQTRLAFKRDQVTCSPNCAATYIETYYRGEASAQAKELLVHLVYAVTGERVADIPAAPRHTEQQVFGGKLSQEELYVIMRKLEADMRLTTRKFHFPAIDVEVDGAPDAWDAVAGKALPPAGGAGRRAFPPLRLEALAAASREAAPAAGPAGPPHPAGAGAPPRSAPAPAARQQLLNPAQFLPR